MVANACQQAQFSHVCPTASGWSRGILCQTASYQAPSWSVVVCPRHRRVQAFFGLTARQQAEQGQGQGLPSFPAEGGGSDASMDNMHSSVADEQGEGASCWELPRVGHAPGFERYEVSGNEVVMLGGEGQRHAKLLGGLGV